MMRSLVVFAFVFEIIQKGVYGLLPPESNKPPIRTKLPVVIDSTIPGQVAPTGFFDPLGFSKSLDPISFKKYQEAEVKHGRVAMLAILGSLVAEKFHPLFGGKVLGASIYHFQVNFV